MITRNKKKMKSRAFAAVQKTFKLDSSVRRRRSHQNILPSLVVSVILVLIISFLAVSNLKIKQKREETVAKAESLQREMQNLENQSKALQASMSESTEQSFLEKEAREKFQLKKPGEEVVVVLPPEQTPLPQEQEKTNSFWEAILKKLGF